MTCVLAQGERCAEHALNADPHVVRPVTGEASADRGSRAGPCMLCCKTRTTPHPPLERPGRYTVMGYPSSSRAASMSSRVMRAGS